MGPGERTEVYMALFLLSSENARFQFQAKGCAAPGAWAKVAAGSPVAHDPHSFKA
jgi:hypothetical protein